MLKEKRNHFEYTGWIIKKVDNFDELRNFNCGHDDLNDYFRNDVFAQRQELLNETYKAYEATAEIEIPVALISLCNDAIRKEKIIHWLEFGGTKKEYGAYPAVKIARFGIVHELRNQNIGTHIINMIKIFFLVNNRTGCRFITVDAYNTEAVLSFYKKNDFQLFPKEKMTKQTVAMFYDLKRYTLPPPFDTYATISSNDHT